MLRIYFVVLLSCIHLFSFSQTSPKFDDWIGRWSGPLDIQYLNGRMMNIAMTLEIKPDSLPGNYHWIISYGDGDSADVRRYILKPDTGNVNSFIVDENNGIFLRMQYISGSFNCVFEVEESLIIIKYELVENQILFSCLSCPKDALVSGAIGDIPEVRSYMTVVDQKAVLIKKE